MGWMRKMKTTAEKRRWAGDVGSGAKLRQCRSPKLLADAWDDIWVRTQRSWKEHRRTKWRQPNR